MKSALLGVALFGIFANWFLLRRLVGLTHAAAPLPQAVRQRPAPLEPDEGFIRRLAAPAAPILAPSAAAFPILWFAQTWSEVILGLTILSLIMAVIVHLLSLELVLSSHRAYRMAPDEEAALLSALHRLGVRASEAWITPTPIAAFWEPAVHLPALLMRSRVLVWNDIRSLGPERLAGIALGHGPGLWPWSLWPAVVAAGFRLLDPGSALPWWLFLIPVAVALLGALPDISTRAAVLRRLRTDASAPSAVRGFLEIELAIAGFIAARGAGPYHRFITGVSWRQAVREARRAAAVAGLSEGDIGAVIVDVASSAVAQ